MELDDFKAHWNTIQQQELKQKKHTPETVNHIIMNATNTLSQLHEKNAYWNKVGKTIFPILIIFLLINLVELYFIPNKVNTFTVSALYIGIMIFYCLVTMWVYNRQKNIFIICNSENLKETLTKVLFAFKRFYLLMNLIYLFLYPVFFYAAIKLLFTFSVIQNYILMIICGVLTAVSLIATHIYYKLKYFKKIKVLEANLLELNEE